jgi:acetylornithine deacetylase/succinyl-diaminopimelate desuccinylase-like protein
VYVDDIFRYIEQNKEKYIEWLQEICRQPSVAAQNRGMEETANRVSTHIDKLGGKAEQIAASGFPVVYGEFKSDSSKTLSFYNHYDVQPEDPIDEWHSPPFGAEIRDGKIYARGVADNKGNLIARLAAVDAFLNVKGKLPANIKFIVEGEEEIGSVHLEEFSDNYKDLIQADGCLWEFGYKNADGRNQVSFGVKGMCYVELICEGANTDLHSANAAVIENPAWRLVWALSTLKGNDESVKIKGFYDMVADLTPEENKAIQKMIYSEDETLKQLGLDSFLLGLSGDELKKRLIFQPTCTICGFESGYTGEGSKTVLPSTAKVKLDFRLVPNQDPDQIYNLLREHLDTQGFEDIKINRLGGEKPAKTDSNDPLALSVLDMAEKVTGVEPTVMPMSPGTGPMYVLCQKLGIPSVSIGVGNFSSNNHAPNENINVDDFIEGIKIISAIIDDFSKRQREGLNERDSKKSKLA